MKAAQALSSQRLQGPVSSRDLALRTLPLVFGVVLVLISDLMIFAGLIASYFALRSTGSPWPPAGVTLDGVSAGFGTTMLAASSGSMLFHYLARNKFPIARFWLGVTILLGRPSSCSRTTAG